MFSKNHGTSDFFSHEESTTTSEDDDDDDFYQEITSLSSSAENESDSSIFSSTSITSSELSCCSDCFCCSSSSLQCKKNISTKTHTDESLPIDSNILPDSWANEFLNKQTKIIRSTSYNDLTNKVNMDIKYSKSTDNFFHHDSEILARSLVNKNINENNMHLKNFNTATLIMTETSSSHISNGILHGNLKFKVLKPCCRHTVPFYYHHFTSLYGIHNHKKHHVTSIFKKNPLFKKINISKLHLYSTCILLKLNHKKCVHAKNNAKLFAKTAHRIYQRSINTHFKGTNINQLNDVSNLKISNQNNREKGHGKIAPKKHKACNHHNSYQFHQNSHSNLVHQKLIKYYKQYKDIEIFTLDSSLPLSSQSTLPIRVNGDQKTLSPNNERFNFLIYKAIKKFKKINHNAKKVNIDSIFGSSNNYALYTSLKSSFDEGNIVLNKGNESCRTHKNIDLAPLNLSTTSQP